MREEDFFLENKEILKQSGPSVSMNESPVIYNVIQHGAAVLAGLL